MNNPVLIKLLQTCMIAGLPRSPVEGLQTVDADEAERLIDAGMAEDASDDVDGAEADDGLEARSMTEKKLRDLADKEGVAIEGDADKPTIVAAIRADRLAKAAAA